MSAAGVLFRDGDWVDISDYNHIIKIFRELGYKGVDLNVREGATCWNTYLSNDDIINISNEKEDYYDVSGTVILYFHWDEDHKLYKEIIPGIEHPVAYFLYIEGLADRSLIVLEFLHRYFERFPTDVFWEGGEYFYTKKDIDKMHAREEPDENWPFMDPATF